MSSGTVAITVAAISLAATGFSGWLTSRAHKSTSRVEEKAGLFEGYDEFVAHLRARVTELEAAVDVAQSNAQAATAKCSQCREDLAAIKLEAGLLRRALGILPDAPVADWPLPFGRRHDDPEVPPPGWPGNQNWNRARPAIEGEPS